MFRLSEIHYDRLAYREEIAKCLKLNMDDPKDRDNLWEGMDDVLNPKRSEGSGWSTGEYDPELYDITFYMKILRHQGLPIKMPPPTDMNAAQQMAISRTLAYIRVLPPEFKVAKAPASSLAKLPDANHFPNELVNCWVKLQQHAHYRNPIDPKKKPRHELNQHALDLVAEQFRERLWIEPHQIGSLRATFEPVISQAASMFWFWPFAIFKHATKSKIVSTTRNSKNNLSWIWDETPGHDELWEGYKNGGKIK
jgi:hypothetical protein